MPKRKPFIDKKKAVTFSLIHRSQKDPLQADEDAPQRVLQPFEKPTAEDRYEEQRKWGVFYDDEYDYLQHLKDVNELHDVAPGESYVVFKDSEQKQDEETKSEEATLNLPSTVFGSTMETDTGMLNKAAPLRGPQLDWDPDIVAAMDEDFDFDDPDNELDDDFMVIANDENAEIIHEDVPAGSSDFTVHTLHKPRKDYMEGDVASDEADMSDYEGSDFGSLGDDFETKTRFTNYSMSSSVMHRSEGLTLLDDRFEKLYEQYDEEEIGALDQEDIGGNVTQQSKLLDSVMEEFEKEQEKKKLKDVVQQGDQADIESGDESDQDDVVNMFVEDKKEKWDCESIISTYSNIYNHPKKITEPSKIKPIQLTKRAGIPTDVLEQRGPTRKQLEQEETLVIRDPANTYRPKDESTDEKKARKQAVKEERKARREEKKSNKNMFKEEKKRQVKEVNSLRNNLQGMQIV